MFGEDQEPQYGNERTVIRSHQGLKTHRESHRGIQIIGDRSEEDAVRSRTVTRSKREPLRAQGHMQERAGSLALSTRSSCPLACSTRARDPSVGKNRNQWAAKPGHYLTGTCCHWLAPVPVRAVAMTVWTSGCAGMPEGGSPLLSGDSHSTPGTWAGTSREKPSSSSSSRNQISSTDTNHLSATTTAFHSVPGPTLSLHRHLQTARNT